MAPTAITFALLALELLSSPVVQNVHLFPHISQVDLLNEYNLLTGKPGVYLVNMSEKDFLRWVLPSDLYESGQVFVSNRMRLCRAHGVVYPCIMTTGRDLHTRLRPFVPPSTFPIRLWGRKKNKWLPKLKAWIDEQRPGERMIPYSAGMEAKLFEMNDEEKKVRGRLMR